MPRVWLVHNTDTDTIEMSSVPEPLGVAVEVNNSLYRQIRAAEKKYRMFQSKLSGWYIDANIDGPPKRVK